MMKKTPAAAAASWKIGDEEKRAARWTDMLILIGPFVLVLDWA
jgi:hypothetical protein